jgi:hypothetical protein
MSYICGKDWADTPAIFNIMIWVIIGWFLMRCTNAASPPLYST